MALPRRDPGGSRNVKRPRQVSTAAPHGPVFGGLNPATGPLYGRGDFEAPAKRAARQRVERAQQRLPARPVPRVPVLPHYTPAQRETARTLIHRSVQKQAGGASRTPQSVARVNQELLQDPRTRAQLAGALLAARPSRAQVALQRRLAVRDTVRPGPQRSHSIKIPGAGTITVNPHAIGQGLLAATSLGQGDAGPTRFVSHALGDVKSLAEFPFVGGYELGAGGYDALAHGNLSRLDRLGTGVLKGVTESAPAALLTGHPGLAAQRFTQHPLLEALNFAAGVGAAGRIGGALARGAGSTVEGAGARGALARLGSTTRPPLAMVDEAGAPGLVERAYSKDLTRKSAQVAADARREPLLDAHGNPVTVERNGRTVPVLKASEDARARHARKQADFLAARANSVERMVRDEAGRTMKARGIKSQRARDLVSMVVEGTITTGKNFERDLRKHAARLEMEIRTRMQADPGYRHTGEFALAQRRLALVHDALNDPRVLKQADRIVAEGHRIGEHLNQVERRAIKAGVISDGERARRARLVPAAIEHMDAYHGRSIELTRQSRALRRTERSLQARVNFHAKTQAERDALRQKIDATRGQRKAIEARNTERLRLPSGDPLEPHLIEQHLRDVHGRDPGTVAYLPHRPDVRGGRAHHAQFRPGNRPVMDKPGTRTGEMYRKGASEASAELIRDQGVRQAVQLAKAEQLDTLVRDHGIRHPAVAKQARGGILTRHEQRVVDRGGLFTAKEAAELAQRIDFDTRTPLGNIPVLEMRNGERLVPMRAYADRLSDQTKEIIREDLQGPGAMESLSARLLNDRILTRGELDTGGARNVVLVPAELVQRLEQHLRPAGALEQMLQMVNRPFRFAVLAQPRWLAGNFIEPYFVRLPTVGSGVVNVPGMMLDIRVATKAVQRMERSADPALRQAAQEIRAQQFGGLFIGGRGASNRRAFAESAAYGKVVAKLPAVATLADLGSKLGHVLMAPAHGYFVVNRVAIEQWAQRAAFGKQLRRDIQEFSGSWLETVRLGNKAVDEASRGLVNTSAQRRFMQAQHELLGKYEGYAPWLRAFIQGPMPFLPWSLNAARFTLWTMPAHHTVLTALLLQTQKVVAQDWQAEHAPGNVPPGSLRFAPRTSKGGFVDVARYTPWGLTIPIAEGDLQGVTDQLLPQASGSLAALQGKDPFGRDLKVRPTAGNPAGKPGGWQKFGIALNSIAESTVPYLATARRLREGGGTAYGDSTLISPRTKPGSSHMSAARRTFDPFRPTYLKAPSSAGPDLSGMSPIQAERVRRAVDAQRLSPQLDAIQQDRLRRASGG